MVLVSVGESSVLEVNFDLSKSLAFISASLSEVSMDISHTLFVIL